MASHPARHWLALKARAVEEWQNAGTPVLNAIRVDAAQIAGRVCKPGTQKATPSRFTRASTASSASHCASVRRVPTFTSGPV